MSQRRAPSGRGRVKDHKEDPVDLLGKYNFTISDILTRVRNMVLSATAPIEPEATINTAAFHRFGLETETAALIGGIENLLALVREVKTLWIRGPLRSAGEDEQAQRIEQSVNEVVEIYAKLVARDLERKNAKGLNGHEAGGNTGSP